MFKPAGFTPAFTTKISLAPAKVPKIFVVL